MLSGFQISDIIYRLQSRWIFRVACGVFLCESAALEVDIQNQGFNEFVSFAYVSANPNRRIRSVYLTP